jgi:hypothetical protein
LFNADHAQTIPFVLPPPENGDPWELLLDTAKGQGECPCPTPTSEPYPLEPNSMAVFRSKIPREQDGKP